MSTSYPKVPNLSTEICRIPAVSSIIHKGSLKKSELKSWTLGDYCLSFCFDEFAIANIGMLDMFTEQVIGKCLKITLKLFVKA